MIIERVEALYFSPTGNVKKVCETIGREIADRMGAEYSSFDFTLPDKRGVLKDYGAGDLIVLGVPVYAGSQDFLVEICAASATGASATH